MEEILLAKTKQSADYQAYVDYVGFKQHFTQKNFTWGFDYQRLRSAKISSYMNRKDISAFQHLSQRFKTRRELQEFMVSSFVIDRETYVRDLISMSDDLREFHGMRMGTVQQIDYIFPRDIDFLKQFCYNNQLSLIELLKPTQFSAPSILVNSDDIGITLETICLLDRAFKFSNIANENPLWDSRRLMIHKYSLLLDYSNADIKKHIQPLF